MNIEKKPLTHQQKEAIAISATLARLIITRRLVKDIKERKNLVVSMGVFLAADIADGVLARKLEVDTPLRRFTDAVVDRVSIFEAGYAMSKVNPTSRPYFALLGVREMVATTANAVHYLRTGEAVQGEGLHKLGSMSVALFALAASTGDKQLTHITGVASTALYGGLSLDYVNNAIDPHGHVEDGVRHIEPNLALLDRLAG